MAQYPQHKYVNGVEVPLGTTSCQTPCTMETKTISDNFQYNPLGSLVNASRDVSGQRVATGYVSNVPVITDIQESIATWVYDYNENNSLTLERLASADRSFDVSYGYNAQDALSQIVYPNGQQVDYAPDAYGRPTQASQYVSNIQYHPNGQIKQWQYENGVVSKVDINQRQLPSRLQATGSDSWLDLTYLYDENNNINQIIDGVRPDHNRIMTYDGLDRLKTASGIWGGSSFDYDPQGNILSKTIAGQTLTYNYATNNLLSAVSGASQPYSFSYDEYGNVTANGRQQFNYDDVGNLLSVVGDDIDFYYDTNNRRVAEFKDDKARFTFYAMDGKLLYEDDDIESATRGYVYIGNQLVARRDFKPGLKIIPLEDNFIDLGSDSAAPITLTGKAFTSDEVDISDNITWESTTQGTLGTGREITFNIVEGNHIIMARVTTPAGQSYWTEYRILALDNNNTVSITLSERINYEYGPHKTEFEDDVYIYARPSSYPGDDNEMQWYIDGTTESHYTDGEFRVGQHPTLTPGLHRINVDIDATWSGFPHIQRTFTGEIEFTILGEVPPMSDPESLVVNVSNTEPVQEGTLVSVSALAAGESGDYEYRFKVKGSDISPSVGEWIDLQGWTTNPQAVWDTAGYFGKTNKIKVLARKAGDPSSKIKEVIRGFEVTNPLDSVELSHSPAGSQPEGTVISLTGSAVGGSGDYEYKFLVKGDVNSPAAGEWLILQDWSTLDTATWDTSGYVGTANKLKVVARNRHYHDGKVKDVEKKIEITP